MVHNLKCISHALGIPCSSSSDEIRTVVDGKLVELRNEPRNMQVGLQKGSMIELANADGVLLQIEKEDGFPPS